MLMNYRHFWLFLFQAAIFATLYGMDMLGLVTGAPMYFGYAVLMAWAVLPLVYGLDHILSANHPTGER
jgi:hypothetical protein